MTVATITERDGRYLMVQETHEGEAVFNQPAGHLEAGETLQQAVVRETLEETGFHFVPRYLTGIYHFVAANGETYIRFAFFGDLVGEQSEEPLDEDIDRVVWFDHGELERYADQLRSQAVMACIEDYEAGRRIPLDEVRGLKSTA